MQKDMEPLECRWKGLGHRLAYFPVMLVLLFKQPYLFNENGWFKLTQCIFDPIVFFVFSAGSQQRNFFSAETFALSAIGYAFQFGRKKKYFSHLWKCARLNMLFHSSSFFSQVYFFHYLFKSAGKKTMQLHSTQAFRLHHNPVGIGNGHWDR